MLRGPSLLTSRLAMVALLAPAVSFAQPRGQTPRVAVGAITGERAAITRSMVASVLADHAGEIELASTTEYNATAQRLGVTNSQDQAAIEALSRELRLDAVVVGSLERRLRGYRLVLRVMRGRDGMLAGNATWEFDHMEEVNALGTEIWERLSPYFRVERAVAPTPTPTPTPSGNTPTATPSGNTAPRATTRAATEVTASSPGLGWLELRVGGGLGGRDWRVPVLGESSPRGYENPTFPVLTAGLTALWPVRRQRMGVGLDAQFNFPLGLSSVGRDSAGREVPLASSSYEFLLGAMVAVRPAGGGEMRFSAGLALHAFDVDTARLPVDRRLSNVGYIGLRAAGEGVLPLWSRPQGEFGLLFGGEVRWVGVSADMKAAFGQNPSTTFAIGAWAGFAARLDALTPGLGLRLTAEFLRYRTGFAGPIDPRAGVGTASDSVDDYTRFSVAVTYAFGVDATASRATARRDPFLGR
ncbi:MAG: hypothetical protein R3A52_26185 [Polyangiales bacterium]